MFNHVLIEAGIIKIQNALLLSELHIYGSLWQCIEQKMEETICNPNDSSSKPWQTPY